MCQERSVDEDNCKRKRGFKAAIGSIQADGELCPFLPFLEGAHSTANCSEADVDLRGENGEG